MVRTVKIEADVSNDREVNITLPADVPLGPAEIVVIVRSRNGDQRHCLGQLAKSEFFGMWRDRTDIPDSAEYARRLREDSWKR